MALRVEKKLSVLVLLLWLWASQAWSRSISDSQLFMKVRHESWMAKFDRTYEDEASKQRRFEIFKDNVEFIKSFNRAGNNTYKLGINEFADLTEEEFKVYRNGHRLPTIVKPSLFRYEDVSEVPGSIDWREKGAVTPIKSQGSCGDCWAFSAVAAIEGIHQISTGNLIALSEQELVDCDTSNFGCHGGSPGNGYEHVAENGISSQADYPYQARVQPCDRSNLPTPAARITGYESPPPNNEDAMLKAVANQPVSAGIATTGRAFVFYESGVITGDCGTKIDHGVTIVGYGTTEDGIDYWLVKNSWGTSWGEQGYLRIQRNAGPEEGLCSIATMPAYPTV